MGNSCSLRFQEEEPETSGSFWSKAGGSEASWREAGARTSLHLSLLLSGSLPPEQSPSEGFAHWGWVPGPSQPASQGKASEHLCFVSSTPLGFPGDDCHGNATRSARCLPAERCLGLGAVVIPRCGERGQRSLVRQSLSLLGTPQCQTPECHTCT